MKHLVIETHRVFIEDLPKNNERYMLVKLILLLGILGDMESGTVSTINTEVFMIEVCNNGIDDDGDGLIDCFDPDCCEDQECFEFYYDNCPQESCEDLPYIFDIEANPIDLSESLEAKKTIIAGDIDRDGNIEIIANKLLSDDVLIIDLTTNEIQTTITLDERPEYAIGDIIKTNATSEIVIAGINEISCYEPDGSLIWHKSPIMPNYNSTIGIADFNEDGLPEIYLSNRILNGQNGNVIVTIPQGDGFVAADILDDGECNDCSGLEFLANGNIYSINIEQGTATLRESNPSFSTNGKSFTIDWNLDGDLDIISYLHDDIVAWNPQSGTLYQSSNNSNGGKISAGNLDQDPEPELVYITQHRMTLHDNNLSVKWQIPIADQSATTEILLFDFNFDGINEIVYRDEQKLRIINAESGNEISVHACASSTFREYPIIIDADYDGEAEILTICSSYPSSNKGDLVIFSSTDGNSWPSSRPVWNQTNFSNLHVNDDLTIPREQQKSTNLPYPTYLNSYKAAYPLSTDFDLDLYVDDVAVDTSCSTLEITICNNGTDDYTENYIPIGLFNSDPTTSSPTLINIPDFPSASIPGGNCIIVSLSIENLLLDSYSYGMINISAGVSSFPIDFNELPNNIWDECSFVNNLFTFDTDCPEIEICDNGIDDDGDGLIDAFDPDCECSNEGATNNTYIQNPGFEDQMNCCGFGSCCDDNGMNDESCVDGWHAVGGTVDYHGLDCTNGITQEGINVDTFNDSFAGFGLYDNFSETIGACLISPLQSGKTYKVDITANLPADFLVTIPDQLEFTLYGFSDPCPDFSTLVDNPTNNICETSLPDIAQELITISTANLLNLQFKDFDTIVTPLIDINYVILSIKCDPGNQGNTFLKVAYIQITDTAISWELNEVISSSDSCTSPLILSIPFSDTLSYQWYMDSIPLNGEIASTFSIDTALYDEFTIFHVFVYNENGCNLIGPISVGDCSTPPLVEICNNGIDDDDDGLIDAFDPECNCGIGGANAGYIQNPGFEEFTDCCLSVEQNESCIVAWEAVGASVDYYGIECLGQDFVIAIEGSIVDTFDNSFIGFGVIDNFSETVGSCLTNPLKAGNTYNVDLIANLPMEQLVFLDNPIEFTLYGFSDPCPDFSTLVPSSSENFCLTPYPDIGEELITISSDDLLNLEFKEFNNLFTPIKEINYVVLSIKCNAGNNIGNTWIQVSYIQISDLMPSWIFEEDITSNSPCQDPFLSVPYSDTLNYQWYADSIPIMSETSNTIPVDLELYDTTTDFFVFIYNANGCTLLGPLNVNLVEIPPTTIEATLCEGETYIFNQSSISLAGIYMDTLSNIIGCDSLVILDLTGLDNSNSNISTSLCFGESYDFNGEPLFTPGIYHDTLTNAKGCDSIIELTLEISDFLTENLEVSICAGETYSFNNLDIDQEGLYQDTLPSTFNCDSIIILDLEVMQPSTFDFQEFICFGDSYDFGGNTYLESGVYKDTLANMVGCDSIIELTLEISDLLTENLSVSICAGETYTFNNVDIDQEGFYQDTIPSYSNCDSIVILELEVMQPSAFEFQDSICFGDSYIFGGNTYHASGVYKDTLANTVGCDSIIELTLEISDLLTENLSVSICAGETYSFNNVDIDQEGFYQDTLPSTFNCDSVIILDLEVMQPSAFEFQDSICFGSSYIFGGKTYSEFGVYHDTLNNVHGCDSVITLTLSEQSMHEDIFIENICEGEEFQIGNQVYYEDGEYIISLPSEDGCDTLLTFDLTVYPVLIGDTTFATIASGDSYTFHGFDYNTEGLYEVNISSSNGCDSLVYLDLNYTNSVHIPNIFSPSSTFGNDHFLLISDENILVTQYKIYDRWGNLVFTNDNFKIKDGKENFWSGYMNNQEVARGVYVYFIEFVNSSGTLEKLIGNVTVL